MEIKSDAIKDDSSARIFKSFATVKLLEETKTGAEGIKNMTLKINSTVANDWNILEEIFYNNGLNFHQKDRKTISFSLIFQFKIWEWAFKEL